tara:strand:- start:473 stop:874 length:402 start_codon:yes stop_codon:yes gene_type:complete
MPTKKIKKSVIKTTFNSAVELLFSQQKVICNGSEIIYTIYRISDKKIFIGYGNEPTQIKIDYFNHEDILIETRSGTKNELNILKATLLELGHCQDNNFGFYEYSQSLIRHLKILGWPIFNFFPEKNQIRKVKL